MYPIIHENCINYINNCRMCGVDIRHKVKCSYISPISETKLTICKKCAIREYYGSKNKRYKKHIKENKLFGNKNE